MFPGRYFPTRYFNGRYWAKTGNITGTAAARGSLGYSIAGAEALSYEVAKVTLQSSIAGAEAQGPGIAGAHQ